MLLKKFAVANCDLERIQKMVSPGVACSWSWLQGDSEPRSRHQSCCWLETTLRVSPGLRTNRKSRSQGLKEEWRSTESKLLELQSKVFRQWWFGATVSSGQCSALHLPRDFGALRASFCWAASWISWFHSSAGPVPALRFEAWLVGFLVSPESVVKRKMRGSNKGHYWISLGFPEQDHLKWKDLTESWAIVQVSSICVQTCWFVWSNLILWDWICGFR